MKFLTPAQAWALLDAAKGDRLEAMYCASLMLAQRVLQCVVMETLRHNQIARTRRYSHLIPKLRREAADAIDDVFAGIV